MGIGAGCIACQAELCRVHGLSARDQSGYVVRPSTAEVCAPTPTACTRIQQHSIFCHERRRSTLRRFQRDRFDKKRTSLDV